MTAATRLLCAAALAALLFLPATSFAGDDDAPSASAVVVSGITQDSAKLTAVVSLGKGDALYWFEYGPTTGLGNNTPQATARHGDDDEQHRVQVSRTLTGLPAGTLQYVRLVAVGEDGRGDGPIASFTTAGTSTTQPSPTTPDQPGTTPPASSAPVPALGASFVAAPEHGSVRVRLPGGDRFVDLPQAASVPVGTIVDARRGTIALRTALADGSVQQASFHGARFKVRQPARGKGRTDLHLRGGSFAGCNSRGGDRALASAAASRKRKKVRRLWGSDRGGRFRTHGRDSVTTVRGTEWSVTDRCDGTVTKVAEGAVDVRVRRSGRVVRIDAGERFLARHRP